jgi:two-component system cell cycle sensor histidine kinase/response regulator CckA
VTRVRRPSVRTYLLGLVLLFAAVALALNAYGRALAEDDSRATARQRVQFVAGLVAKEIDAGVAGAAANVAALAPNPALQDLVEPTEGCTLTFAGAGALEDGHLDVVAPNGTVVCSSLPDALGRPYDAADLPVGDESPAAVTEIDDPVTGHPSLAVAATMPNGGTTVVYLSLDGVTERLHARFGGPLGVHFTLGPAGHRDPDDRRIWDDAPMDTLGWEVVGYVEESVATADADDRNKQLLVFLAVGLAIVAGATLVLYRGVARPIEQLHAWVRGSRSDEDRPPPPVRPKEIAAVADEFEALTRDIANELQARTEAEQHARVSAESYRVLFDSNPQPMWVHELDSGQLVQVNRAMLDRFGCSADDLLSRTIDQLVTADVEASFLAVMRAPGSIDRGGPWPLLARDGEVIDCEITSDVLVVDGVRARLVIAEDVTNRLRTEQLLRRAERMDSLGQLAGGMAHDFNNILAVIMSMAEFVTEELRDAALQDPERWRPVLHDIEQIGAASSRGADLTRQLLAFARGEASTTVPMNVGAVVDDVRSMLSRTLGEQIDLRVGNATDLWTVRADRGEIEQVIVNLAVNARDAMPSGGTLSIETANVEVDEHNTAARPDLTPGRYVRMRVSDTGAGMDPEVRDKAFNPFFTTKPRGSGTGLGLATVYGIVTRAGGSVQIYSEPGLGTSVSVMLPATEDVVVPHVAPSAAPQPRADALVLVVEDDEDIRSVAERILTRHGYRVVTACDGAEALELADRHADAIDLVLTDVVMPGMLGSELVQRLRERWPAIRVLLMSGYAPPIAAADRPDAGVPLLDKPFSASSLLTKVDDVLSAP